MNAERITESRNERGIALVTVLMLTLLLSILVGAMLVSSTADVLISGNDVRTNQAFYAAEAGINRAAGWFSAKFGADPNSGLYVLPEQNPSNSAGVAGKLSYLPGTPFYQKGISLTSPEQTIPTSVKVLAGGVLQNVVLAGDSSNTFPANYTVKANDPDGAEKNFVFNNGVVINDFTNSLVNQTVGDGQFSVKATLISITKPDDAPQGTITWLIESNGRIMRGNTAIASATMTAYLSARLTPIVLNQTVEVGEEYVAAEPGVIGRGMIEWNANKIDLDSYKSSKGAYKVALASGSYPGQIGSKNVGSRGDMRTNNEFSGYIHVTNGTITGKAFATSPVPGEDETGPDPITIDTSKVDNGQGGNFSVDDKHYDHGPLVFPDVPEPTPPPAGASDYSWTKNQTGVLPPGNYRDISITNGRLTVPPGNYGNISVTTQGEVVLGVPGMTTTYNFQGFTTGAQAKIIFNGPVIINVKSSLDVGAQSAVADLRIPASAIRWNFKGGNNERIYLGGGGSTLGVFYAPNNDLEMRGGTDFYGAIVARNVDVRGNASIHIDEDAVSGAQISRRVVDTVATTVGYTATSYSLWRITQSID